MARQGNTRDRTAGGGQRGGCAQLRPGCAGWYQACGCCVAAYAAGWVLWPRGAAPAERGHPDGDCPRFTEPSAQAGWAVAAPPSSKGRPPSWLSAGGRAV
jgi:hypothetical protein